MMSQLDLEEQGGVSGVKVEGGEPDRILGALWGERTDRLGGGEAGVGQGWGPGRRGEGLRQAEGQATAGVSPRREQVWG